MDGNQTTVLLKNVNNIALDNPDGEGLIKHHYNIPNYQRGYRWERNEVITLLDDIWTFLNSDVDPKEKYCLQPIVLQLLEKKEETGYIEGLGEQPYTLCTWNVVDGQQRLTTLYLIMRYLSTSSDGEIYSLSYSGRGTSDKLKAWEEEVLDYNPKRSKPFPMLTYVPGDDLDLHFMSDALGEIATWFENKRRENTGQSINAKFNHFRERVHVIWYEIGADKQELDAIDLFTRLNIGKIPLTNAELIKAILLKQSDNQDQRQQQQKAQEWDQIESDLSDDEFFHFLCNAVGGFEPRIDYLFNLYYLIRNPGQNVIPDGYGLFSFYAELLHSDEGGNLWTQIKNLHQLLQQWYRNHSIYHKIGFLVACSRYQQKKLPQNESLKILASLVTTYQNKQSKRGFDAYLTERITETVAKFYPKEDGKPVSLDRLNYLDHSVAIEQLLLLFNVLAMEQAAGEAGRFSFNRFLPKNKTEEWSLEHICPQHPEGFYSGEKQKQWLIAGIEELEQLQHEGIAVGDMAKRSEDALRKMRNAENRLAKSSEDCLSPEEINSLIDMYQCVGSELSDDQLHMISNLALLPRGVNSSLGNGLFFQKRLMIMEHDKNGRFIPLCTHNVFLKYYSQKNTHLYFWTESDREAYYDAIKTSLSKYIPKGGV